MPVHRNEFESYIRDAGFDTFLIYDGSSRIQYVCLALPGTATSSTGWCIFKLSYDGTTTNVVKKRYASGTDLFDKIADSYSTYNYTDL
jgi:hypothetical protein